jgi:hypothetical protein
MEALDRLSTTLPLLLLLLQLLLLPLQLSSLRRLTLLRLMKGILLKRAWPPRLNLLGNHPKSAEAMEKRWTSPRPNKVLKRSPDALLKAHPEGAEAMDSDPSTELMTYIYLQQCHSSKTGKGMIFFEGHYLLSTN